MGQRLLYLVRHGRYVLDREDTGYGRLTSLGRRQAKQVGRRFSKLPIDCIHHSSQARAMETAQIAGTPLKGRLFASRTCFARETPRSEASAETRGR